MWNQTKINRLQKTIHWYTVLHLYWLFCLLKSIYKVSQCFLKQKQPPNLVLYNLSSSLWPLYLSRLYVNDLFMMIVLGNGKCSQCGYSRFFWTMNFLDFSSHVIKFSKITTFPITLQVICYYCIRILEGFNNLF